MANPKRFSAQACGAAARRRLDLPHPATGYHDLSAAPPGSRAGLGFLFRWLAEPCGRRLAHPAWRPPRLVDHLPANALGRGLALPHAAHSKIAHPRPLQMVPQPDDPRHPAGLPRRGCVGRLVIRAGFRGVPGCPADHLFEIDRRKRAHLALWRALS